MKGESRCGKTRLEQKVSGRQVGKVVQDDCVRLRRGAAVEVRWREMTQPLWLEGNQHVCQPYCNLAQVIPV